MEVRRRLCGVLAAAILFVVTAARGQDLSSLQQLLVEQRLEEVKRALPQWEKKYPNHPTVLYAKALLAKDGDKAAAMYEKLVQKHPDSPFADDALFKLAQYQFAKGLYLTARQTFDRLVTHYPSSPYVAQARYFAAQCLLAVGKADSARIDLAKLVREDPRSPTAALAQKDLQTAATTSRENQTKAATDRGNQARAEYTIQVGAFSYLENALQQWEYFSDRGYPVVIHERRKGDKMLYLVWVGTFANEELAKAFGRELKDKWGVAVKVVEKQD